MQDSEQGVGGFVCVAIPTKFQDTFDYRCDSLESAPVGSRVVVPFGKGNRLGVIVEHSLESQVDPDKIRSIHSVTDPDPVVDSSLLRTLRWTSQYYHQPIGEVLWTALPKAIRIGSEMQPRLELGYRLSEAGSATYPKSLARGKVQSAVFELLKSADRPLSREEISAVSGGWQGALRQLISKQLVVAEPLVEDTGLCEPKLIENLTEPQANACDRIKGALDRFKCFLIHGVTGSGKTEVYLQVIYKVLQDGGQALILVPEIGLTPQLEERVSRALGVTVSCFHSGMSEAERHKTWWNARTGNARVVIGTRSGVFLPFRKLAMIVIDEEHDASFKQNERVRYHARAVAIHRAANSNIPLVFGTATPSIETIHAGATGRLETISLPERATKIRMPSIRLVDLGRTFVRNGIAVEIFSEIEKRIRRGEQSLIFLNRRGFAPVSICMDCKWVAKCNNCDVNLNFHASDQRLHCHHCFARYPIPQNCPDCMSNRISQLGEGTQQIERVLKHELAGARVMRIDRDTTKSYAEFQRKFERIRNGEVDVLVGTQMVSKGHDFPNVTLVCILNTDQSFFSMDFRATEHMVQQILQVAGRSGRFEKPGVVLIQTMFPEHEVFTYLKRHDYLQFTETEIRQRKLARQPPFAHYVLLRTSSPKMGHEFRFLNAAHADAMQMVRGHSWSGIRVFDIVQSPIQKISNRYRAQLLVSGETPKLLRQFIAMWMPKLEKISKKGQVRWSLDVDPIDFS